MTWRKCSTRHELMRFYEDALPRIRKAARSLGYAIGLHGSMARDLDLIAVPWVEGHGSRDELAAAIQRAACGMTAATFTWHEKPCGRVATSLPVCWTEDERPSSGHIDLSVVASGLTSGRAVLPEIQGDT